ncbi:hypothetical protein GW17_00049830, partial [Ensete ventricosum]
SGDVRAAGGCHRELHEGSGRKRKEPTEAEVQERGDSIRELCEVYGRAGADRYFTIHMSKLPLAKGNEPLMPRWSLLFWSARVWTEGPLATEYLRGALHPILVKQLYKCPSEELMDRASKSAFWVYQFSPLLYYMVCVQHERITALRVANKELQFGVRQEAVSTVEQWVKELQATVDLLRAELESSERRLKVLEQEVNTTHTSL